MTDEERRAVEQAMVKRSLEELSAGRAFGYPISELEAAFALVKPAGNWKMPIRAAVPADADLAKIDAAVCYYTGGGTVVQPIELEDADGTRREGWLVVGSGYYANIGS